jgi:hypothetical protein
MAAMKSRIACCVRRPPDGAASPMSPVHPARPVVHVSRLARSCSNIIHCETAYCLRTGRIAQQVKEIEVLSFAEQARSLSVDYIRYELRQEGAAILYHNQCTGMRGRYCIAAPHVR